MIRIENIPPHAVIQLRQHDRRTQVQVALVVTLVSSVGFWLVLAWSNVFSGKPLQLIGISLLVGMASGALYGLFGLILERKICFASRKHDETRKFIRTAEVQGIRHTYSSENGAVDETFIEFAPETLPQESAWNDVPIYFLWQQLALAKAEDLIGRTVTIEYTFNRTLCLYLGSPDSPESGYASIYPPSVIALCGISIPCVTIKDSDARIVLLP
jgi:hypothetical protein